MAMSVSTKVPPDIHYPDSDGRPLGETPVHVRNSFDVFWELDTFFLDDPQVYVAANMFVYYVQGDRNRHVSPDVFLVRGVPKHTVPERRSYRVWENNGKAPNLVIEITSASTCEEDRDDKMTIYRDTLGVQEYFLFDPYEEYLEPRLQGYRLRAGEFLPIEPISGRLPSEGTGLHLEADGWQLRLYDPATGKWLRTPQEEREARQQAEAEIERLRRELEQLRIRLPGPP